MKKPISVLVALIFMQITVQAQFYMTAGGLRAGTDWGLTVQQRITKNMTIEGIVQSSLQREEVLLTALAERHYALGYRGLNIYTGAGLHKGFVTQRQNTELEPTNNYKDPMGVTFIGGAELTLGRINISYDFKPAINLTGGEKRFYTQSGVSLRYVLLNNKEYKKIQKKKKKKEKQKRKEQRKENGGGIRIGDGWKIWKKD
ncbi:MAG: hypothetical protein AAFZ15_22685 [Bacteroidota bacterium]